MAIQDHSKSRILGSAESQQGTTYILASWVSKDIVIERLKITFSTVCPLTPLSRETVQISVQILYCQNVESLGYISAVDSMGISSMKIARGSENHLYYATVYVMAIQGHPM